MEGWEEDRMKNAEFVVKDLPLGRTLIYNHQCSAKRQVLRYSAGAKAAVLQKAGLPPQTQEPRLQFYQ